MAMGAGGVEEKRRSLENGLWWGTKVALELKYFLNHISNDGFSCEERLKNFCERPLQNDFQSDVKKLIPKPNLSILLKL